VSFDGDQDIVSASWTFLIGFSVFYLNFMLLDNTNAHFASAI